MAFTQGTFLPLSAQANSSAPRSYHYKTADAAATVKASGYFNDAFQVLDAGDIIIVSDGAALVYSLTVVAVSSAGVVTTQLMTSQELTASAAITPGVDSIELNHATVAVVTTIADAKAHQGLFIIKDTSASGTAAHTVTLTIGTFNVTGNTVATLNAPLEFLAVWFDSAGKGEVLVNVGSVALS